jgi:hypothetical protein
MKQAPQRGRVGASSASAFDIVSAQVLRQLSEADGLDQETGGPLKK